MPNLQLQGENQLQVKKTAVWILLCLLIVVPFLNWRIGALIWLCAWIIYLLRISLKSINKAQSKGSGSSKNSSNSQGIDNLEH
jgi:hypothetical protein